MAMAKQHKSPRTRGRKIPARGLWQRGKWWLTGGGVAGSIALLVVLSSALSNSPLPVGGELAPDIALATADGAFRLSDRRGEVSLLYFSFPG